MKRSSSPDSRMVWITGGGAVPECVAEYQSADRLTVAGIAAGCDLGIGPGHQLIDTRRRPQVDQLCKHVGHPHQRINRIQLTCLDHLRADRWHTIDEVKSPSSRALPVAPVHSSGPT